MISRSDQILFFHLKEQFNGFNLIHFYRDFDLSQYLKLNDNPTPRLLLDHCTGVPPPTLVNYWIIVPPPHSPFTTRPVYPSPFTASPMDHVYLNPQI